MFINVLNMDMPQQAWIKKTVQRVETHWLASKEKLQGAAASKEGYADSLLGHKKPMIIDFFEKDATVNSTSYCQLIRQNSPYLLKYPLIFTKPLFTSRIWHKINFLSRV